MALTDRLRRNGGRDNVRDLRELLTRERWQSEFLSEDLRRLELQMEDEGWRRLTTRLDREFTRGGLDDLMRLSRAMYLSHPLIQRAVNVRTYYTWGQGVSFQAADERIQREVVEPLTADRGNRSELFCHQARVLADVDQHVDGNTFHALFTTADGSVSVRSIPAEEVREIHTHPEDRARVWFYRRAWSEQQFDLRTGGTQSRQREVLYPDWHYRPASQPESIGGIEVRWDAPVIHLKTGGLRQMRFGIPETYAALDWARAYSKFLRDWHTIVSSLAVFAWQLKTKGRNIESAKDRLHSTIEAQGYEDNPPPAAGSVFISSADAQLAPIPKTGATTSAEDARPSRLMVASAMDLPDTILAGDPDMGNLATAKTLDRPTELAMRHRQVLWADFHRDLFRYAAEAKVIAGALAGKRTRTPDGLLVEPSLDADVEVTFPSILEHDANELVRAIVTAATLDGKVEAGTLPRRKVSELLLSALGVEDVQAALDDLGDDTREALAVAVRALAEAVKA